MYSIKAALHVVLTENSILQDLLLARLSKLNCKDCKWPAVQPLLTWSWVEQLYPIWPFLWWETWNVKEFKCQEKLFSLFTQVLNLCQRHLKWLVRKFSKYQWWIHKHSFSSLALMIILIQKIWCFQNIKMTTDLL